MLRVGDRVRDRWQCLELTGTVLSLQPSISLGSSVQYCEVDFKGKRRWILSINLIGSDDLQVSERHPYVEAGPKHDA